MIKRIVLIVTLVLALSAAIFYVIRIKPSGEIDQSSALNAVLPTTPVFFKVNDCSQLSESIYNNSEMWETFLSLDPIKTTFSEATYISSLIDSIPDLKKQFKGKEMVVSLNLGSRGEIDFQYLISLPSKNDFNYIEGIVEAYAREKSFKTTNRKYNTTSLTEINLGPAREASLFFAYYKGVLAVSTKSITVEETLRQLDHPPLTDDPELNMLLKTINQQAVINLFVNHKTAGDILSQSLSKHFKLKASLLKNYAAWSEFDLTVKKGKILLTGFSNCTGENNFYSNILRNQPPEISRVSSVLPSNISWYSSLCISDLQKFFTDYELYLSGKNQLLAYKNEHVRFEKETKMNLKNLIVEMVDVEIATAGIPTENNFPDSGRAFIIRTKSGSFALNKMVELQKHYYSNYPLNGEEEMKNFHVDKQTSFPFYRFPFPEFPMMLFGPFFGVIQTNWFTVFDNYLIFSDSFACLGKIIQSNILGETLLTNIEYNKFQANLNIKSNYNFFCNTDFCLPASSLVFDEKNSTLITQNENLRKFKMMAWQVSSSGAMVYNNASLLFSPEIILKPQTVWKSHMKSPFDFKPQFVKNHNDPLNKEIILQDRENTLYLINNIGRIIWQVILPSPIIGEIHQIDLYKNGKLQFLFNTAEKIYLLDRNGNFISPFPITLRSEATNGVAVFDYENNRNYRFIIACTDRTIYAYDSKASFVDGWTNPKTDHPVSQTLQHFVVDGKDFIVASDKMKDYFFDRRGTIRVRTDVVYPHSPNNTVYLEKRSNFHEPHIVTTDQDGNIHRTYFNGKHETIEFKKISNKHFFVAGNIDPDEMLEYIFADQDMLYITKSNGKTLFTKKLDHAISHKPTIYHFSYKEKKVGFTSREENKIYLYDINGNLHNGFPLEGCSGFSIGFIAEGETNFNLLVASPDGYLYNYYVE